MIAKDTALETILQRIDKLPVGHALDLRTYKRNRSVLVHKTGPDSLRLTENGYVRQVLDLPRSKARKELAAALAREFPRSAMVRVYALSLLDAGEAPPGRKKI